MIFVPKFMYKFRSGFLVGDTGFCKREHIGEYFYCPFHNTHGQCSSRPFSQSHTEIQNGIKI